MAQQDPDARLRKSYHVLLGWTWMSRITDDPEQVVRILNDEVVALARLAVQHPGKAQAVLKLIMAYKALAERVTVDGESGQGRDRGTIGSAPPARSAIALRSAPIRSPTAAMLRRGSARDYNRRRRA